LRKLSYLYLEPYVNIFSNNGEYLLYNTLSGFYIESSSFKQLTKLFDRFRDDENMYFVELSNEEINNPIFKSFINDLKMKFMGDLLITEHNAQKPIQLFPILNFQKDEERFKEGYFSTIGDNIMYYLSEITLYLNSNFSKSEEIPENYIKQFHFPRKKDNIDILTLSSIKKILKQTEICNIETINILGGDIFLHQEIKQIVELFNTYNSKKIFHFYYKELNLKEKIKIASKNDINIYIDSNLKMPEFSNLKPLFEENNIKIIFILQSEIDYVFFEKLIVENSIQNYDFKPFYNGKNDSFFEDNIYLTKEDLFENIHEQNDIFAKSRVNFNNFGKLIILNDGNIYSNINNQSLGNINKISIKEAIYDELQTKQSWCLLKKDITVCRNCIYNQLCPPISNYEYAIGKYNLCHVWKEN
jgi:pseudo-rSAM protein